MLGLIKRAAASEQWKLQQLISGEELGDRKPTTFLEELFLQRLRANVRIVIASADATTDLSKLADMADKIVEVATPTVAAVSEPSAEILRRKCHASPTSWLPSPNTAAPSTWPQ